MSHVTAGLPCVNPGAFCEGGIDLEATRLALEHLAPGKFEVVLGQTEFKWVGRWYNDYHAQDAAYKQGVDVKDYGKCSHVIRFKRDPYEEEKFAKDPKGRPNEVGLVADKQTGMLRPVFDFYGSRGDELKEAFGGAGAPKLTALVTQYKVTLQTAKQSGHYVKSIERLGDGRVQVRIGVRPEGQTGSGGTGGGGLGG